MEALLAEAHSHSSTEKIKRQPPPASPPLHAPTPATPQPRPATSLHCKLRRHTWLLAEDFGAAPSTGPLLRGFTAPMHMARRARHGEATKAWRHSSLKIELSRNARVDDTCWRRPGDAMAWRSAACAYACEKAHSRGRRSRFELRPLSSGTRPLLATPNPPRAAHAGPPSICTRSITNFLGSSLEGYHLLTPLMPIEEENSCLAKCWPGSGGEDRAGHHAGPIGDEELAKGKPRQVTPSAARACLRRSLPAPALAPPSPRPTPPRHPACEPVHQAPLPPTPIHTGSAAGREQFLRHRQQQLRHRLEPRCQPTVANPRRCGVGGRRRCQAACGGRCVLHLLLPGLLRRVPRLPLTRLTLGARGPAVTEVCCDLRDDRSRGEGGWGVGVLVVAEGRPRGVRRTGLSTSGSEVAVCAWCVRGSIGAR